MADYSVNDLWNLINQQIDYQEDLGDYLSKANALLKVALELNFFEQPDEVKHHFLWNLDDVLDKAKVINELSLDFLFCQKKLNTVKS